MGANNTDNKHRNTPLTQEQVQEKLLSYATHFNIRFDTNELTLGLENTPLNTILIRNICDIIDNEDAIHIVLRNSTYILRKATHTIEIKLSRKL